MPRSVLVIFQKLSMHSPASLEYYAQPFAPGLSGLTHGDHFTSALRNTNGTLRVFEAQDAR